jgi:hypothetical protein
MAKSQDSTNTQETEVFNKGLIKDYDDIYFPEGTWSHARNATNNTVGGDVGIIGNEPATLFCAQAPYTIIGQIRITGDYFAIFSTDDTSSEIGLFKEGSCTYSTIVNDSCLNFKKSNLIIGAAKENFDCSYQLYWVDSLNPDRTLNIGDVKLGPYDQPWPGVPYICDSKTNNVATNSNECFDCQPTEPFQLDCEKIRLTKIITIPCIDIQKGQSGGTLLNGSYYAAVAYSVNKQRVTDYIAQSIIQPLFDHDNSSGSLEITIDNLDIKNFDEFQLVIVSTINQQTSARVIGYYNTKGSQNISIDNINNSLPSVPVELLPLRSTYYEKSDGLYVNGQYMLRTGPKSRFDFNYQPLANQIGTEWVIEEYKPDYYKRGGNKTGYMRDEQYAFWIRFVYNTGEKSASYHIPGRSKEIGHELESDGETSLQTPGLSTGDNIELAQYNDQGGNYDAPEIWQMINTAYVTYNENISATSPVIEGKIIAAGKMGYWESTEKYPDSKPDVWNASIIGQPQFDLCGKHIRHHKMPSDLIADLTNGNITYNDSFSRIRTNNNKPIAIRLLGVRFNNIKCPVDNYGVPIPGITGYEILRSSREGNRTIIAKGIINNMRGYTNTENEEVLYQNYPYNYNGSDPTITKVPWQDGGNDPSNLEWNKSSNFADICKKNIFTFHSPETSFKNPFLTAQELKLYGEVGALGNIVGNFEESPLHPKHKLPTDMTFFIALAVGIGIASKSVRGKEIKVVSPPQLFNAGISQGGQSGGAVSVGNVAAPAAALIANLQYQLLSNTIANTAASAIATDPALNVLSVIQQIAGFLGTQGLGTISNGVSTNIEKPDLSYTAPSLRTLSGIITYSNYINEGTDATLDVILSFNKFQQYALRYLSHADLHKHSVGNVIVGNSRRYIRESGYLNNQLQNFQTSSPTGTPLQSVFENRTINNIFRSKAVLLNLDSDIEYTQGSDNSVQTVYTAKVAGLLNNDTDLKNFNTFKTTTHSYYGALKIRLNNQYGQLETVRQIPTGCTLLFDETTSTSTSTSTPLVVVTPAIYGGDIYVGRYTEKNTFFYFYDWLYNQPDGTEFDYRLRSMINNPRFWADFTKFDTAEFIGNILDSIANIGSIQDISSIPSSLLSGLPSNRFNFDNDIFSSTIPGLVSSFTDNAEQIPENILNLALSSSQLDELLALVQGGITLENVGNLLQSFIPIDGIVDQINAIQDLTNSTTQVADSIIDVLEVLKNQLRLVKKYNYFYLFQSGVRDFFVESEINIDLRDWGNNDAELYYDPYRNTNLKQLFDINVIKAGNYFKYDISLSVSKVFNNFISWGNMQPRFYDAMVAETCYTYYPNRVIYSLPQQDEGVKDYWQVFLANNYKDFTSRVTSIKQIGRNGALLLFESQAPAQFLGVDTLQTGAGTKLTIGDGGLFSQPLQYLSNADAEFQHGSCQNRLSVTNTPMGVYFVSESQGKVFAVTGKGLEEISAAAMRWWFNKYLPYQLTKDFPDYSFTDNPVIGIGCQSVFDNSNQILYFSKRDFRRRRDITNTLTYAPQLGYNTFLVDDALEVQLGNPDYFEDCSWTISYDPKNQMWISFHDWIPEIAISSKNYFLSSKTNTDGTCGIWRHNDRTDLFANYYGIDYPFEIEYIASTGQIVNTLKSIEYDLECYTYDIDGIDMYHVLDFNFDHAVVHNTEQVSGVLNLNLAPKGNPIVALQYPVINPTSIDILYDKVEQKYRFNQFWDITRDRGEFTYPNVQQPIWNTELNGYKRQLNINNLDYQKPSFERKKFRHYTSHILLYRNISGPVKMLFKLTNNKDQYSPR